MNIRNILLSVAAGVWRVPATSVKMIVYDSDIYERIAILQK